MSAILNEQAPQAPKQRAANIAYDAIENMIVTLQLKPGAPIIEAELLEKTGLGRTPMREALMRMSSNGLIRPMPRRGLVVSQILAAEHLQLIETRRVLENLIVTSAAQRADAIQKQEIMQSAEKMLAAAKRHDLNAFMEADQSFDHTLHTACGNASAVAAVVPLVIQCRRFWYAYQHEGDIEEGARCHLLVAKAVARGHVEQALKSSNGLMDYLESFTRKAIPSAASGN
ncbi:GntR family transcriptional regulator [Undibacterium griseum]|uniref:GntR family transcriptional regulator n=1 Tax=Undibacterium griseum TaxID=2762295 RepID=A0ABR6YMQ4_9BURK|nr:GntR family transcriptional regulator [Undibacterium griseum]MBC3885180.1 GntR family transcriptional regulator [Undibacterium griseum]